MEPLIGMPPMPRGRQAVEAWRTLPNETRRRLLDGEHVPDVTGTVIAVGYARTMLARTRRWLLWPVLAWATGAVIVTLVVGFALRTNLFATPQGAVGFVAVIFVPTLSMRLAARRRLVRLVRMDTANSARLWANETPPPNAPPPPTAPQAQLPPAVPGAPAAGEPIAFRYSPRRMRRLFAFLGLMLVCDALIWLDPSDLPLAIVITVFIAAIFVIVGYGLVRRGKPWLPPIVFDAAGITLPPLGVKVAWHEVTEIRITPVRTGRAAASGRRVAAFLVTDSQEVLRRFPPYAQKQLTRSVAAYATPISVVDVFLGATAEDIVAAARRFTNARIRRFG